MSKKGYTLIEVMIGISLFSILILGVFSLEVDKIKMTAGNKKKEGYILYMQALKAAVINDLTYDELVNIHNSGNKYVNSEDMKIEDLKGNNIAQLFKSDVYDESLYIDMTLSGEKPVKVTMKCHVDTPYVNEVIICEFYKGSYY